MNKFELVSKELEDLPYMKQSQALVLRDIIHREGAKEILEIGFYQGKSSSYIAAILEDQGEGSLTTFDRSFVKKREPNIDQVLEKVGLSHRVTPIYCHRSYTWELQKLINMQNRPQFDLCYFDGGHTWDDTGFGVALVSLLIKPGGILLLDDMDWSMARSPYYQDNPKARRYSQDEREAKPVRLVWDSLLPSFGFELVREYKDQKWGMARKRDDQDNATDTRSRSSLFARKKD